MDARVKPAHDRGARGTRPYLPRIPPPPHRRILERAGPDAALGVARLALGRRIAAAAVLRVVDGVARAHHDLAEIAAVDRADRDVAAVAVVIDRGAADLASGNQRGERARGGSAAGIGSAGEIVAALAEFRCVDAVEADALAGDVE